ncbi:MAG TPA: DUF4405 domain-containing protein [Candidatus Limiplasma sp.]|nr:DUF4405 domain-containing protein [Candidatus Limiplasma sp.]
MMMALLALMYSKHTFGLAFHEIGGLALCGLFIIHKLLNWPWIKAVSTGLFSRHTPARQKVYWVLDLLLFASFTFILVSGILISKVVFPGGNSGGWIKPAHYGVAALALMLTGVHIGLHIGWISQRMAFFKKFPVFLRRGLAVLLSAVVLAIGCYQFTASSCLNWVSSLGTVLSGNSIQSQQDGGKGDNGSHGSSLSLVESAEAETETGAQVNGGIGPRDGSGPHGNGNGSGQSSNAAEIALRYLSILLAFAVVTAWADMGLKRLKRRRKHSQTVLPGPNP